MQWSFVKVHCDSNIITQYIIAAATYYIYTYKYINNIMIYDLLQDMFSNCTYRGS